MARMSDREEESRRTLVRRAQRKAGERSATLARRLMDISEATLRKLALEPDLRKIVDHARSITAKGARRREERGLAGALRGEDIPKIVARLAQVEATGNAEPELLHLAERWRTRLIEEGLTAAAEFPGGAVDPLPQLMMKARSERDTGRPPGAARALFRHVHAVLAAAAAAEAAAAADAADDD